uniref:Potassium/proton antiporter CemA n=1 Tax=Dunaliella salina TaxID=3046 RepID=A0A1C8XRI0_DUNSA|nr:envelope membrane protein [Dunaliella salina]
MIQKKQNFLPFLKSNSDPSKNLLYLSKDNKTTSGPAKLGLNNDYYKNQKRFSRLTSVKAAPKQEVVSITYEEIGLFPRSFSRVLDRFLKQIFSDVENLVIQEYRFYRYLFLTTLKCLLILFFVPFLVNFLAKSYVVRPLTEYFWNTKQTEIFLNSYQQKHAFAELKDFEEKLYFESLIYPKSLSQPEIGEENKSSSYQFPPIRNTMSPPVKENQTTKNWVGSTSDFVNFYQFPKNIEFQKPMPFNSKKVNNVRSELGRAPHDILSTVNQHGKIGYMDHSLHPVSLIFKKQTNESEAKRENLSQKYSKSSHFSILNENILNSPSESTLPTKNKRFFVHPVIGQAESNYENILQRGNISYSNDMQISSKKEPEASGLRTSINSKSVPFETLNISKELEPKTNSPTSKHSFLVYQTIEADKNIQQRYQEKTIELAQRYNDQSVEAITNFFGDVVSLVTLFYLLYVLEIQINITQSFLLEVFFGLDDSKKSLLILLVTDLLVGYHSSNLWELFFELFFNHYGLPESQTGIFLLVATLPVLLDVLFKYLIFRHLNRSSPATVATYHAIIE